jgi:hypothetical protein
MSEPKTDCRFYYGTSRNEICTALKGLYCTRGKCNFYKSKYKPQDEKERKMHKLS